MGNSVIFIYNMNQNTVFIVSIQIIWSILGLIIMETLNEGYKGNSEFGLKYAFEI